MISLPILDLAGSGLAKISLSLTTSAEVVILRRVPIRITLAVQDRGGIVGGRCTTT